MKTIERNTKTAKLDPETKAALTAYKTRVARLRSEAARAEASANGRREELATATANHDARTQAVAHVRAKRADALQAEAADPSASTTRTVVRATEALAKLEAEALVSSQDLALAKDRTAPADEEAERRHLGLAQGATQVLDDLWAEVLKEHSLALLEPVKTVLAAMQVACELAPEAQMPEGVMMIDDLARNLEWGLRRDTSGGVQGMHLEPERAAIRRELEAAS